jgi:hypothetical protein
MPAASARLLMHPVLPGSLSTPSTAGDGLLIPTFSYEAVWPRVLGLRPIQIVVVRDPEGRMQDCYLFTTDLQASANWVLTQFAWRSAIEAYIPPLGRCGFPLII